MKIPSWPAWLPYPISWLRGFGLVYILSALVSLRLQSGDNFLVIFIGAWLTVPFVFTFFHWALAAAVKFLLTYLPAHPKLNLSAST
jgi:hypothetical protein